MSYHILLKLRGVFSSNTFRLVMVYFELVQLSCEIITLLDIILHQLPFKWRIILFFSQLRISVFERMFKDLLFHSYLENRILTSSI